MAEQARFKLAMDSEHWISVGVELPDANVPYNVSARPDAKLAAMVKS